MNKRIENNLNEAITCLNLVERELKDNDDLTNDIRSIVDNIDNLREEIENDKTI